MKNNFKLIIRVKFHFIYEFSHFFPKSYIYINYPYELISFYFIHCEKKTSLINERNVKKNNY